MGRWKILATLATFAVLAAGCGNDGSDTSADRDQTRDSSEATNAQASDDAEPERADAEPEASTAAAAEPAAPDASPYVLAFGDLSAVSLPDGDPGEVSIVWAADTIDRTGSVLMIVRNNTAEEIGTIEVTGTARDNGELVASGSSQGFNPAFLAPGEVAYGYVYFDYDLAEKAFEFSFDVRAEPAANGFAYSAPVSVTELNYTGDRIVGSATNEGDEEVGGPISVNVLCFNDEGIPIDHRNGFLEQNELAPGATGSFSIDLLGNPCPNGLVSVSGYSF